MGLTPMQTDGAKGLLESNVISELADLMLMMDNWKRGYETWGTPELAAEEFTMDIQEMLVPYLQNLIECGHVPKSIACGVMNHAYKNISDLRESASKEYMYWV